MAEIATNYVIEKLSSFLIEEVKLLAGVHKEVANIKDELESIRSFLREADVRAESDESLKPWVKQVREVAHDIEDIMDEAMLRLAQRPNHGHGFFGLPIRKLCSWIKNLKQRHVIADGIHDIKTRVSEIKERKTRYSFDVLEQGSSSGKRTSDGIWHDPRMASLFIEEAQIVGIEQPRTQIISWLVEGESKRAVISVVGHGGVGKTTLVKKVYDNQRVLGFFECRAWVTVSPSYNKEEILRSMIEQLYKVAKDLPAPQGIDTMAEATLKFKIRDCLQKRRYVIVFDDVWNIEFWRFINDALIENNKGSRIIITTRMDNVANAPRVDTLTLIYHLQPLGTNEAWALFCKKVFQFDFGGDCPRELEKLSFAIVKRCGGLPLVIVAIGGLLSMKDKVPSEWKKLNDSLGHELQSDLRSITSILLLSYHDLPYYLKSCFLYFGIFLDDYSVSCAQLIRLWVAEGFVNGIRGKTLEELAEDYLNELIHRNLVQVSHMDSDGRMKRCRVHDLMREIILLKSEGSFYKVLTEQDKDLDDNRRTRRLSIQNNGEIDSLESIDINRLRSLFLFKVDRLSGLCIDINTLFSRFNLVKVLNLEGAPLEHLPEELGNLFLLRYLSVRRTKVKMLPKSIGKLINLETLDLKYTFVDELPTEILRLRRLRHLIACYGTAQFHFEIRSRTGIKLPEADGLGLLTSLQKLHHVKANHDGDGATGTDTSKVIMNELSKLRQMRKLGITRVKREDGMALCTSIEKMNHLLSLSISSIDVKKGLDLQAMASPPTLLRRLFLQGYLEKFPIWISSLNNLLKLCLDCSFLMDDPLNVIKVLPNLLVLELHNTYMGEQLYFEAGGFMKLQSLGLMCLLKLTSVIMEQGTLPVLDNLSIANCRMDNLPLGIEHLQNLNILQFRDMPFLLINKKNYWKVAHVPNFYFLVQRGERYEKLTIVPDEFNTDENRMIV